MIISCIRHLTVSKTELEDLYVTKELSTKEVSKIYNCNTGTVWYWLNKYGIPTRSSKVASTVGAYRSGRKLPIPVDEIIRLYTEEKVSLKRIGKMFSCCKQVISDRLAEAGVPRRTREVALTDYGRRILWSPETVAKRTRAEFAYWSSITPERRSERLKLVAVGANRMPNIPEITLLGILSEYFPDEWRYVGNGSVMFDGLNPDFINVNGRKLIIELFGNYWHGVTKTKKYHRTEQGRIDVFKKYGYHTLVIWEHEIKSKEKVVDKIARFLIKTMEV